ncbi:carbohydrate ABC transporter substrate-binding protein [Amycolatopsis rhizosphaerae]|uniref:Carbohydrate ABC transporter substrate-binding protein n=1 Tax=Amycolatopsis rhizosphaerae TaxID=2053003 RepID=A0A558CSG3_9PSEU|nr:extracellular solute-binding protein [Amycolatopsis rhizosphaerae]TVT51709.1 carbohydrate ABC transporter substrate-binding protein [Amycolatopsis rhizosphaerae]
MRAARLPGSGPTRRAVLQGFFVAGAASLATGCVGFSTTGAGGMVFLSTQFRPVAEAERFRAFLARTVTGAVSYVTIEEGPFASQVQSQVAAGRTQVGLLGGSHSDLAPLAGRYLEDVSGVLAGLGDRGWPAEYLTLAKAGTAQTWYVPWAQASFVLAAHADALEHLPPGADPETLTYDQLLDWAIAARRALGRPVLGLPCGPKGLIHRFLQGYLLPSFTGGQITTFRSDAAVTAWQYLRELWANCAPASTNYDFMQEPLARGEVSIGWDHVARLIDAPGRDPAAWRMLPAPRGPRGLGYMAVVLGLAIPKGSTDRRLAERVIRALSVPHAQVELLRSNGFFPVVATAIPPDLPPALQLEADAVRRQRDAAGSILSLLPVGLGTREGEVTKAFKDSFQAIVLGGADIRSTLDKQAAVLQKVFDELKVPCWAPDPPAARCEVA